MSLLVYSIFNKGLELGFSKRFILYLFQVSLVADILNASASHLLWWPHVGLDGVPDHSYQDRDGEEEERCVTTG